MKIFDKLGWHFVLSALSTFGYGYKFIHMINVAFTNIQCKIKVNDLLSYPFFPCVRSSPGVSTLNPITAEVLADFIDKD